MCDEALELDLRGKGWTYHEPSRTWAHPDPLFKCKRCSRLGLRCSTTDIHPTVGRLKDGQGQVYHVSRCLSCHAASQGRCSLFGRAGAIWKYRWTDGVGWEKSTIGWEQEAPELARNDESDGGTGLRESRPAKRRGSQGNNNSSRDPPKKKKTRRPGREAGSSHDRITARQKIEDSKQIELPDGYLHNAPHSPSAAGLQPPCQPQADPDQSTCGNPAILLPLAIEDDGVQHLPRNAWCITSPIASLYKKRKDTDVLGRHSPPIILPPSRYREPRYRLKHQPWFRYINFDPVLESIGLLPPFRPIVNREPSPGEVGRFLRHQLPLHRFDPHEREIIMLLGHSFALGLEYLGPMIESGSLARLLVLPPQTAASASQTVQSSASLQRNDDPDSKQ